MAIYVAFPETKPNPLNDEFEVIILFFKNTDLKLSVLKVNP